MYLVQKQNILKAKTFHLKSWKNNNLNFMVSNIGKSIVSLLLGKTLILISSMVFYFQFLMYIVKSKKYCKKYN